MYDYRVAARTPKVRMYTRRKGVKEWFPTGVTHRDTKPVTLETAKAMAKRWARDGYETQARDPKSGEVIDLGTIEVPSLTGGGESLSKRE